ncbi:MAG: polysaccharide pyruvyl transferase family protein [Prevotella sp.]|nr:polysaccharide pyruvyl transferase family protein [Prevotella sp.]
MKKIGIVTFHNAWNNGAFLQAFAMQMFLDEHGYQANIVNTGVKFQSIAPNNVNANEWWREYEKRLVKCHNLLNNSLEKCYDAIVYGSDEIWNLNSNGANPIFWGYNLKSPRKIAYAPCSGGYGIKSCMRFPCKVFMAMWALNFNFHAISARDKNTKRFIKRFSCRTVAECLDPTFLADFTPYRGENGRGDYIAVYSYGLQKETINKIKEFGNAHNCKIVYTGSYCDWADENPILDPIEWFNVMYHAKYVFTSTFHGCVFSIICHREFYVVDTNSAKVNDLLERLRLTERKIKSFDNIPSQINFSIVQQRLNELKQISEDYILSNIK